MTKQTIHPPTSASLSRLAMIQGDDRCVLTVYFPGSLTTGPKAANKLMELPETLLGAESLTPDETEHRRRSLDLWHITVRKVLFPSAPGWVGVVSWLTEDVAFMQLPVAVDAVSFFSGHYALALREKRLSVVQTLYRIWWVFGLILFISVLLVLILIAILALRKGEPVVEGAVILFSILLSFTILLGVPTLFYWMGLRGLQEMAKDLLVLGTEMLKIENKTF